MPSDLSSLADAVFKRTGQQKLLVNQLAQRYSFKAASPNEGHSLAAALLAEGAVAAVVTLNFDLALSTAIAILGVGDSVGIIEGPEDLPNQKAINLYYLHRNVTTADAETWVLRTEALKTSWKKSWESVVTAKVFSTPVVVFVGLGSPADVLIESTRLIKEAIPDGNRTFQVDPGDPNNSEFFKALALGPSSFIQAGWCDFMNSLAQRLVLEQASNVRTSAAAMMQREHMAPENIEWLINRLHAIGLLEFGKLRASWLLHSKLYCADESRDRELIADLLLAVATFARITGTVALLCGDGVVEFRNGNRIAHCRVFASGLGSHSPVAVEAKLSKRGRQYRRRTTAPTGIFVAATRDNTTTTVSAPHDVLSGEISESIITGRLDLPITHIESLRQSAYRDMQASP
jgi:hypothetical protein